MPKSIIIADGVQEIVNSLPEALYIIDMKGQILDGNPAAEKLTGYKKEELIGKDFLKIGFWTKKELVQATKSFARGLRGKKTSSSELTLIRKDKTKVIVEVKTRSTKIKGEKVALCTVRNISEKKTVEESLRESRQRLQDSQAIAHVGSWHLDIVNNKLWWSDEVFNIFGLKPKGFKATYEAFLKTIHPDDRDMVSEAYTRSLKNKTKYDIEHRIVSPKGKVKIVREQCKTIYDKNGKPLRSIGSVQDITKHKLADNALKESEDFYGNLLKTIPLSIFFIDIESEKIVYANPAAAETYGYTLKELIGSKTKKLITKEYHKVFEQFVQGIMSNRDFRGETIDRRKDGILLNTEVFGRKMMFKGKPHLLAIISNVTERKKAEEALKESSERISLVLEGADLGAWDWNIKTDIANFDARWMEMIGYKQNELPGNSKTWIDLIHPEDTEKTTEKLNMHFIDQKVNYSVEFRMKHKSGNWVWILARGKVVERDVDGKPVRMTGTHLEITERKIAEKKLREMDEMKSRFITAVTHVTRTPLTNIGWSLENLLSGDFGQLKDEQKVLLNQAVESKQKISGVVMNMSIALDIGMGALTIIPVKTSLVSLVKSTVDKFDGSFQQKGLKIKLSIPKTAPKMSNIDGEKIKRVLEILLNNALRYSSGDQTVNISVTQKETGVRFSIKDKGIGIPKDEQGYIFDRFFRASNASTSYPDGMGVGLYIAKAIVEIHKGQIGFDSAEGMGSTFWFELPF